MTFTEAEEYRLNNVAVIGQHYKGVPAFRIEYLLIAPKNKTIQDRQAVLNECLYNSSNNNEQALKNLGFLYENLDVYIGTNNDGYKEKLLGEYLSDNSI